MCIEDIRMGRKLAAAPKTVSVTFGTIVPLCGPDPMRTRLIVSSGGANVVQVAPQGIDPTTGVGFTLSTSNPIMAFKVEEFGKLVTGPWTAFTQLVTTTVVVVEASLEQS